MMTRMTNIRLFIIFSVFFPLVSLAQECLVSTTPPKLIETFPGITEAKLNSDTGRYGATLNNGDIVQISYAPCDLGLRGHYLSMNESGEKETLATIKLFLTYLLPSETVANQVLPQLNKLTLIDFQNAVELRGINDKHKLTFRPSNSSLFQWEVHYEWVPPLH